MTVCLIKRLFHISVCNEFQMQVVMSWIHVLHPMRDPSADEAILKRDGSVGVTQQIVRLLSELMFAEGDRCMATEGKRFRCKDYASKFL